MRERRWIVELADRPEDPSTSDEWDRESFLTAHQIRKMLSEGLEAGLVIVSIGLVREGKGQK